MAAKMVFDSFLKRILAIIRPNLHEDSPHRPVVRTIMRRSRVTSVELVLRAALLTLFAGCGIVSTKAPQPVGQDPSSGNTAVAPSGLQLGFVWQQDTRNLYPILGVTASARFGAGILPANSNVVNAVAASSTAGSWALLLDQDGTLQQLELPSSISTSLASGVAIDSAIVVSPSGTSAALISPTTRAIVVVSGMPSKPQVAYLAFSPGTTPSGAAVSDAGTILAGLRQGASSAVQLVTLSELHGSSTVGSIRGWGGAGFVPNLATPSATEAAVVADGTSAQVTYVSNINGNSPKSASLATSGLLQTPVGVGISTDGNWAFVADSAKAQVVRLSVSAPGTAPTSIACACRPQQLYPLNGSGVYSVGGNVSSQPIWILDTRTVDARTFFVPAMAPSPASQKASAATQRQLHEKSR
jgi:hypothetical protein